MFSYFFSRVTTNSYVLFPVGKLTQNPYSWRELHGHSHHGEKYGDSSKTKNRTILQFHSWAYIWRKRLIWKDICTPMFILALFITVQTFSSVAQSCLTLCDPMNCSMPGLPVHHHLPEFTQTHVHRVGNAIQPSHPLSSPSPPAPNPSQHQSLFQWVNSSHEVAKVLEFQL